MRKYDSKNKRNIGIILGVCIIFAVIFSYFLFQQIKISKIKYELEASTVLFDIDKNSILLNSTATVKKKWNKKYYLTYEDEQYNIGSHVIAFNNKELSLYLYGEFYEIFSNSEVEITKEETILNNLGISRFYKIADRKYLIVDPSIKTEDSSLQTTNYLIVELDKQGNAILYNNSLNVKVFSATKLLTSSYTFDIANELLIYENNDTVDLKKILGTTNEYKEDKNPGKNESQEDTGTGGGGGTGTGTGAGTGTGQGGGTGTGTGGESQTGGNGGNAGTTPDDDIITDENGTNIGNGEIINQTANTSILRITPYTNSIEIDYVIYDKTGEYITAFVEVEGPNGITTTFLSKTNTNIKLNNLSFGTNYELTFKYTHLVNNDIKEEVIGTYNVTTLLPNITLKGTKATNKLIEYEINSSAPISSAKLRLYVNGERQINELTIPNDSNKFSILGIKFPSEALVELRLEDIYISGTRVNKTVSWSYRAPVVILPEEPETPDNPEEPTPEEPVNPEPETPPEDENQTPSEDNNGGEGGNNE